MYYSGKYYAYIQVWKNNVSELPFQSNAGADYSNENTLSATWLMKPQKSDRIQLKANSSRDPGPLLNVIQILIVYLMENIFVLSKIISFYHLSYKQNCSSPPFTSLLLPRKNRVLNKDPVNRTIPQNSINRHRGMGPKLMINR